MDSQSLSYVLITPARNEAKFIEPTIKAVVSQTILPRKWVIVSDGSTDGTDDIVRRYIERFPWIELVRMPERKERHFAAKVNAFRAGYERMKGVDYDLIANLDADITFEPDYLEFLVNQFVRDPKLGVAGTNRWEGKLMYDYRFSSSADVAGACQLFRRACFEEIGGYKPVKGGGIDLLAGLTARMYGWTTRSFSEKLFIHHRLTGSAGITNHLLFHYNDGRKDFMFGGHPVWEVFRAVYRMRKRPFVLSGGLLFAGYFLSWLKGVERPVTKELIRFRRREQMGRLGRVWRSLAAQPNKAAPPAALAVQGILNQPPS